MVLELRRAPGALEPLLALKESLDFGSAAWAALFSRMGGAALLAAALRAQVARLQQGAPPGGGGGGGGGGPARSDAAEALSAALQCAHALAARGGLRDLLGAPGFLREPPPPPRPAARTAAGPRAARAPTRRASRWS